MQNNSKVKFAERLHHALDSLGWKSRGRPKQLQNHYGNIGVHLSEKTFHKWLNGQSFPDWDNLIHLVRLTKRSINYLIYGLDDIEATGTPSHHMAHNERFHLSKEDLKSAFIEAVEQAAVFNLISLRESTSPQQMYHAFVRELGVRQTNEEKVKIPS
ncbi:hypothetical protein [Alteromonas sp. a30]|uniref:hypothetical protein n=1 Tax=Alteromonas sp. a30 TaxID=2730917 RepID=UPI00227F1872|nr:hypothetical protein [Alteromonas sp. a30]